MCGHSWYQASSPVCVEGMEALGGRASMEEAEKVTGQPHFQSQFLASIFRDGITLQVPAVTDRVPATMTSPWQAVFP